MKQIIQSLKTGTTDVIEIPCPAIPKEHILIKTSLSLISSGTEKMLVDFGKSNFIQKAQKQPDKVKEVIEKVNTDGLSATYNAIKSKLDQPIPMGYSNVGEVVGVGAGVSTFQIGDRVASNGAHAEYVTVPSLVISYRLAVSLWSLLITEPPELLATLSILKLLLINSSLTPCPLMS